MSTAAINLLDENTGKPTLHYLGSYADAVKVYDKLGPHTPIERGKRMAIVMARAELTLNSQVVAAKTIKHPKQ